MEQTGETSKHTDEDSVGVMDLMAMLLRHPRAIFYFPPLLAVVVVVVCFIIPARYTAVTTFIPEVSSDQQLPAGLAGVAGQLGLTLGNAATTSPRFFADVLKSRAILEHVLQTQFPVPGGKSPGDSLPLLQLLEVDGDNPTDSLQNGTDVLSDIVGIQVDAETNVITLSVTTRDRDLSAAVANTFLHYLDEFNTLTRQSKGREQRRFVEARLRTSAEDLKSAELSLKEFYQRNRTWQQSPELTFQEGQFSRHVEVEQELYLTLVREFEKAQIDEVNDTPGITVIDAAVPVEERSFPRPALFGIMSLVVAFVLGIGWAVTAEFLGRLRAADPAGYARLVGLIPNIPRKPR
jgi:uncharacterized protein involved in exopolysaccharide biosynthesis